MKVSVFMRVRGFVSGRHKSITEKDFFFFSSSVFVVGMQRISVAYAKDGQLDGDGSEKLTLMLDTSVAFVELMWPLQDR